MSLAGLELTVRERLGLDPSSLGESVLRGAIEQRMKQRSVGTHAEYAQLLSFDVAEVSALAAELAVPETWFFRGGRALFSRMAEFVATRAATRPAGQPVRVLSIPCSTGEEPYSLAIAFHENFIPPEQYTLDAVDYVLAASGTRLPRPDSRPSRSVKGAPTSAPRTFSKSATAGSCAAPYASGSCTSRNANLTDPRS
ncbi:MAG: CheR family methyltransferase [Gemmataceae bacterium]